MDGDPGRAGVAADGCLANAVIMVEPISEIDAQYALELVKTICSQVGPGVAGTLQERERAAILQKELELHLGVENVSVEEFTFAPGAFLGSLPIGALFLLLAAALNFTALAGLSALTSAAIAVLVIVMSILIVVFELILGVELIDPLF